MSSRVLEEDMNINANRLLDKVVDGLVILELEDGNIDGGQGRFIKCRTGGCLIAMCYHKTKHHKAIAEVHNNFTSMFGMRDKIVRDAVCTAPPGKWACAWCESGKLGGNEAYYKLSTE